MHPFASYVLRTYYKATGWNEDNLYANLTRSSNAVLDFTVPRGLHFTVSKSPNPLFKTTYSMTAMPSLSGSLGYIFTSCDLNVLSSGTVRFKDMLDRFKVYDQPRRPEGKEEEWLAGERVDTRDYLLYGRFYLPSGRLDALYSTRLSPTVQLSVAAISDPISGTPVDGRRRTDPSNIMLNLQHDVGKWCTEYTYSAEDSMWGVRFLHNFGRLAPSSWETTNGENGTNTSAPGNASNSRAGVKRVDEEDAVEGGLRGRVSVGAELYFSAKERSAGVSTGIRFSTMPDATPPSAQIPPPSPFTPDPTTSGPSPALLNPRPYPQPPTTITALFNPMLGHIQSAYTARVSRDLALATRFDFNVYSYDSEWTMGAEWWLRRSPRSSTDSGEEGAEKPSYPSPLGEVHGVVKARASTNNDVSLMWEGRIRQMLVSLGVVSDLSSRAKPIKAIGIEVSYFSSE
ncbi:MDM10 [Coprinopsis cinerea okayama7|uniref:Mitochondrial distribution and morphology protein 10 n=1 Tax=Coprinopsis cinerea (strain Okayama-7 / 130 / ATCC MYA-4618 / FGSC 9003) TaxID=240176 RepID=MDM10_COPC7|nr:MDM10 [Coprinopsis cinerea okayama7\|eukprot:XP_001836974.1 MDM10 [Coprinopsis cinerea okayama7\